MTVSFSSTAGMLFTIALLAALPGASIATVVSQALAGGWRAAFACTFGIILGDLIYLAVALLGISWIEQAIGRWSWLLELAGGIYLIWTGYCLFRSKLVASSASVENTSPVRAALAGLSITLADQKAILFYLAFFPTFIDTRNTPAPELIAIIGMVIVAVAIPKLAYAALAVRIAGAWMSWALALTRAAGLIVLAIGVWLMFQGIFEVSEPRRA